MTHTQNISVRNGLVRITMGLTMVAYGTSYLIKNPTSNKGRMMIILGAMKAGEGTLRYCPTKALMDSSIQNIMSQNGALGSNGNSTMQNMGTAMQNVGSTVQNMMSGSGSGSGSGLQNIAPDVGQLMKDFAGIGGTTSGNQQANSGSNQQANSGGNNKSNPSASGNNGASGSTANNNASGNTNKNTTGKANNNSANGNKNNSAGINPS